MADKGVAGARLTKLGRYEVLNELGKGAMGVVYLAKDPVIGRMVAIKTIRASSVGDDDSESREFRERFVREAQTAGILSHPNIVTIHDIGEDTDTQTSFIAMEYIEGKNLKTLLAEKAHFSYDQIADVIAQVAEAIDYAHRKGIIHRDIKPANIIITSDEKVKITDFGIAKVASSNLTTTGQFLGTPNYMSPEQVSGAPVDGRSDIFSLGVVLYELLTGRKPFQGDNLTAISYKIVHEDFTPPAELSSEVPPEFNPIVARAMAKDPWNRYQRGKDFALALHQLRAHLEEQRALQDLGTLVAEAEFMPTLRLANLEQLVAEGAHATEERSTEVIPPDKMLAPEPLLPTETLGGESGLVETGRTSAAAVDTAPSTPSPIRTTAAPPIEDWRTKVIPREEIVAATSATPLPPATPPLPPRSGSFSVAPPPPRSGAFAAAPPPPSPAPAPKRIALDALKERTSDLARKDWRKLLRAEVNPPWFFGALGAVALFWILILLPIFIHSRLVARPTSPVDGNLKAETQERKQAIDQAKKLFAAGQYEQALALCRSVLSRSPNNQMARQYAQMAENAIQGRQQQAERAAQADRALASAQAAFAQGNWEEARRQADEALTFDGGRLEAQKIRDESSAQIAEAQQAAARMKPTRPPVIAARRAPPPTAAPVVARATEVPVATVPAPSGPTTLRLLFESPISEGNVMVAVNDQILLRKQFDFRKKEGFFKKVSGTGTVDVSLPVKPGQITVKAWLSGPDVPASVLAQVSGQISGGETRVLRLDYSNGRLAARIQ